MCSAVSPFDADDLEDPNRNKIVWQILECHTSIKLLLHGYHNQIRRSPFELNATSGERLNLGATKTCPARIKGMHVVCGKELLQMVDKKKERNCYLDGQSDTRRVEFPRPSTVWACRGTLTFSATSSLYVALQGPSFGLLSRRAVPLWTRDEGIGSLCQYAAHHLLQTRPRQ